MVTIYIVLLNEEMWSQNHEIPGAFAAEKI